MQIDRKVVEQALEALEHSVKLRDEDYDAMDALKAALEQPEDKSQAAFEHWVETVEATQGCAISRNAVADAGSIIQPEIKDDKPFGYFRAEPFGWTDCAPTDEGAIPLYTKVDSQGIAKQIPPEAQTEAEKIAYCAGWWAAMEAKRGQKMRDAGYTRRPTLREMAEPVQEPEQEPVAYVDHADGSVIWKRARLPGGSLLYTAPPQPPQPAQEPKERWCSACGYVSTRCLGDEQSCVWNWSAIRAALPHRPSAPIIQPEIKADKEPRWLPMPWKGLTEEEHNYYKALGFVGVKAVEEKLRAKNSTLACIPAVPPG
jgi:hypothetical protein